MTTARRTRSRRSSVATASAKHARAVRLSAEITLRQWQIMKKREPAKIELRKILQSLIAKRIPFVLTGAHAIGGWTGDPRATHDVDILVKSGRNYSRAVKAMRDLYPHLEVRTFFGVTAFFIPGDNKSVIDVVYPHRDDIAETLAHPIWIEDAGLKYRIPSLEAALANKYGAMLALNRDRFKRGQDAIDFGKMVQHSLEPEQAAIDLDRLRALGEMVWPGGGGKEILKLVEMIKQGGIINLSELYRGQ